MFSPPEIADKIKSLVKLKNTTIAAVLRECGCGHSVVNDMRRGQKPSAETISKIARALNVSQDYLLGIEDLPNDENVIDNPSPKMNRLPPDVRFAFNSDTYRELDDEDIEILKSMAERLLANKRKKEQADK